MGRNGAVFLAPSAERAEAARLELSRGAERRAREIAVPRSPRPDHRRPSGAGAGERFRNRRAERGPRGRRRGRRPAPHRARLPRRAGVAERGRSPRPADPDPGAAAGADRHRPGARLRGRQDAAVPGRDEERGLALLLEHPEPLRGAAAGDRCDGRRRRSFGSCCRWSTAWNRSSGPGGRSSTRSMPFRAPFVLRSAR